MNAKLLVSNKLFSVMLISIFSLAVSDVRAEYYIACAGPDYVECVNCVKHRVVTHHKKYKKPCKHRRPCVTRTIVKRNCIKMEVYYITNSFVPPCACGDDWLPSSCGCRVTHYRPSGSIVGFSSKPTPLYDDQYVYETESSYFYDRGTADDDSYVYPDMNIDH